MRIVDGNYMLEDTSKKYKPIKSYTVINHRLLKITTAFQTRDDLTISPTWDYSLDREPIQ